MDKVFACLVIVLGGLLVFSSVSPAFMNTSGWDSGDMGIEVYNVNAPKVTVKVDGRTVAPTPSNGGWVFSGGTDDTVAIRIVGTADGGGDPYVEVSGDMAVSKEVCRDKNTRKRVLGAIAGDPETATCTALSANSGDKLVIRVMGTVAGADTGDDEEPPPLNDRN